MVSSFAIRISTYHSNTECVLTLYEAGTEKEQLLSYADNVLCKKDRSGSDTLQGSYEPASTWGFTCCKHTKSLIVFIQHILKVR